MITCPYCKIEMREILEYINVKNERQTVYYCPDCDSTLVLPPSAKSVVWHDAPEEATP
jgi:transposase-like protein